MNKLFQAALAAGSLAVPQLASAQALPAPVVGVVDTQRAVNTCNACKTASAQLEAQEKSLKALQASLSAAIATEQKAIETSVNASAGKDPDGAIQKRIDAWNKKRQDSDAQFSARATQFERNRLYINQQIGAKFEQAVNAVIAKRGITLLLDANAIVRAATAYDLTAEVLAQLNASLTSVSTNAPAGAAAPRPATSAPKPTTTPKPGR